eukprot:gene18885-22592_t
MSSYEVHCSGAKFTVRIDNKIQDITDFIIRIKKKEYFEALQGVTLDRIKLYYLTAFNQGQLVQGANPFDNQLSLWTDDGALTIPNNDHLDASLTIKPFELISQYKLKTDSSQAIWAKAKQKNGILPWSSEADIVFWVREVMDDIIEATGLDIKLAGELGISQIRPDIWILLSDSSLPIGVVEVKKPSKYIMNNDKVHGQILDYMLRLQHMYGQITVFGIVTTYEQWRVYWLPDTDEYAQSDTLLKMSNPTIEVPTPMPSTLPALHLTSSSSSSPIVELDVQPKESRVIHGSNIIEHSETDIHLTLCSVLLKMYYSPHKQLVPMVDKNKMYIVLSDTTWFWSRPSQTPTLSYDIDSFLSKIKKSILIMDLRGGEHGRVWLACDPQGRIFVLKFSTKTGQECFDSLTQESMKWNDIWGLKTVVKPWNQRYALMMPYVKIADDGDWNNNDFKEAVKDALSKFDKAGFYHADLHRRHVGKYYNATRTLKE